MSYLDIGIMGYDTLLLIERCELSGRTCCVMLDFAAPKM
jgi:hypothetical protein